MSHFIQHNPLPPGVAQELRAYFNVSAQQSRASLSLAEQKDLYRNLPLSLQVEVARVVSRDSLLGVQIFENTSDYFLVRATTVKRAGCMQAPFVTCRSLWRRTPSRRSLTWRFTASATQSTR